MAREGITRITADVPSEDVQRLDRIAKHIHSNKTTALVRAIRLAEMLEDATRNGGQVIIVEPDGTQRRIVLA